MAVGRNCIINGIRDRRSPESSLGHPPRCGRCSDGRHTATRCAGRPFSAVACSDPTRSPAPPARRDARPRSTVRSVPAARDRERALVLRAHGLGGGRTRRLGDLTRIGWSTGHRARAATCSRRALVLHSHRPAASWTGSGDASRCIRGGADAAVAPPSRASPPASWGADRAPRPACQRLGPAHAPNDRAQRPALIARAADGIAVRVPRGWHVVRDPLPSLSYPRARVLLTSYRSTRRRTLRAGSRGGRAAADGALVFLLEYRPQVGDVWSHLARAQFAPRPATWRLGPARATECWRVPSHTVLFQSRAGRSRSRSRSGRTPALRGTRRCSASCAACASRRCGRFRRTRTPAGARSTTSRATRCGRRRAGPVRVTKDPRSVPQPRTLFAAANARRRCPAISFDDFPPSGVQVRVVEERHGHASPAFPPFPHHAWPAPGDFHAVTSGSRGPCRGPHLTARHRRATRLAVLGLDRQRARFDRRRSRPSTQHRRIRWAVGGRLPQPPAASHRHAARVRAAHEPQQPASVASCRRLSHPRHHSPLSPPPTFTCRIAVNGNPTATFDVQVLPNGCFVAERRRPGQADYGCIRR